MDQGKLWIPILFIVFVAGVAVYTIYNPSKPEELPLTPAIITDKEQYHVGETVKVTYQFHNPNSFEVSFTPPNEVYTSVTFPGDPTPQTAKINLSYVAVQFIIPAKGEFNVISSTYNATKEGTMRIGFGGLNKIVKIIK